MLVIITSNFCMKHRVQNRSYNTIKETFCTLWLSWKYEVYFSLIFPIFTSLSLCEVYLKYDFSFWNNLRCQWNHIVESNTLSKSINKHLCVVSYLLLLFFSFLILIIRFFLDWWIVWSLVPYPKSTRVRWRLNAWRT